MIERTSLPRSLEPAYARLCRILEGYGSMVIAYSGGVDSGLLAYVAYQVLGERMIAIIGESPSLATREETLAVEFLQSHGIPHDKVKTEEMMNESYRANTPDRCYFCKTELFVRLERFARDLTFSCIAYGANVDDRVDYRPGSRAAAERRVVAPLVDARLGKRAIRDMARALGLSLWDKPAAPCLASRIPYHSEVTASKLTQVEAAERVLKDLGFPVCRVRHYGRLARVEVPRTDHERIRGEAVWRSIVDGIKAAGFGDVVLDEEGFRSGRLNDALGVQARSKQGT